MTRAFTIRFIAIADDVFFIFDSVTFFVFYDN